MIINFIKKHKYLLMAISLVSLGVFCMMLPSFIDGRYFVGGGDVKTQNFEFFLLYKRELINALRNHTLPFYSWVLFLGNNIWASKAFYGFFDIYNLIMYLVPLDFYVIYAIQCYLKILVASITMYLFLSYQFKDKKWVMLGSICYALSSYALYFTSSQMFISSLSFMPLYFLGIEMYLKENKKFLFIISSSLLLLTHFYLFYSISLFSPIYFIYRYYNINHELKGLVKKALILILYYVISVLICGAFIFPTVFYLLQNDRVGAFDTSIFFEDISILLHSLCNAFIPSHTYIYANNIFDQGAHNLKEICAFCGSIIPLVIPQIFICKDKYYKKSTLIVFAILCLFYLTPIGNSIMLGFSEPCFRWTLLLIFFNIIVAINCLENIIDKKVLLLSFGLESLLSIVCFFVALLYKKEMLSSYYEQLTIIFITIIFAASIYLCLIKNKNRFLIAITTFQLILCGTYFGNNVRINGDYPIKLEENKNVLVDNYDYHNLKFYLDSLDVDNPRSFYRVYIPYNSLYWTYSLNFNIVYNIQGLTTYDSMYAPSFNYTRSKYYDYIAGPITLDLDIEEPNLIDLYNTKYSITTSKDEIPFETYEIVDDHYRGSLYIAKNNDYQPGGVTYSNVISYEEFENIYDADSIILKDSIISENKKEEIQSYIKSKNTYEMSNIITDVNYMYGEINCDEDSFMLLGVPYDDGWTIKVNDIKVKSYLVNGGLTGIPVFKGDNIIQMYFVPKGFKEGAACTSVGALAFVGLIIIELRKRRELS